MVKLNEKKNPLWLWQNRGKAIIVKYTHSILHNQRYSLGKNTLLEAYSTW